jgi:Zn finger protein HypA/HybF involved in hydrogenase expression
MAKVIRYKCSSCAYEADIYEGRGFMGQHIVTMSCPDCHTLQPLVVGGVIGDAAPSFNSIVGRLCLHCGSDRIREWDGRTCPACGGLMEPTDNQQFWT